MRFGYWLIAFGMTVWLVALLVGQYQQPVSERDILKGFLSSLCLCASVVNLSLSGSTPRPRART